MAKGILRPLPALSRMDIAKFWAKVDKRGPDECWPWKGARDDGKQRSGYGKYWHCQTQSYWPASRVSVFIATGTDPNGLACHHCDYPPCVNPLHLFVGSHKDNMQDAATKGRTYGGDRHHSRLRPETLPRGEKHKRSKLTSEQVTAIRGLYGRGLTCRELGERFSVSASCICKVATRIKWKHLD